MKNFFSLSKLLLALLPLWLSAARLAAQAPGWQAAAAISSSSSTGATVDAIAAGSGADLYVLGTFAGTATFGGTTLTSVGGLDVYVAKWNSATNAFTWAVGMGGANSDFARGLVVSGNVVYVGGDFGSPSLTAGSTTLTSAGGRDIFVARLNDAGSSASVAWASRAGGADREEAYRLAVSGSSVYVCGLFAGTASVFGSTTLSSAGSNDIFVAKLTDAGTSGSFTWALRGGGATTDEAYGLAAGGGNVYVGGAATSATLTFGSTTLTGAGDYDAYVAKIADAGATASFVWAQRAGGSNADGFASLALQGSSIYAAGAFESSTLTAGSTTLAAAGGNDVLLAKLTDAGSSGSFTWATRAGGSDEDFAYALTERNGELYVAGFFRGAAAFGSTTLTTAGQEDVFVARVHDSGASPVVNYAQRAGGSQGDVAYGVSISSNRLYVGGIFTGSATFGSTTLGSTTTVGQSGFVAYLLDPVLATTPAAQLPGVVLYPNPARGTATLQLPAGVGAASFALLDALGRVVRTDRAPAGREYLFDLTGLAPGMYALRVRAGEAVATRQLLVE